jgi:hypothetical protein
MSRFRCFWPWCSSDPIQTAELVASVDQGAFGERLGRNARYADHFGVGAAFLSLAAVGIIATACVWFLMPETRLATTS